VLTVRELLADLDGVRLLAGQESTDAPIRWVHISELPDPTPWMSGGELLLTTGMQLGTPKKQREFVARLADHHIAGLGVALGHALDVMPPAMIAAAEDRGFVLFEIDYEVPFIAITEHAFTRLVNEQYAVLQRSIAAHERLERIVLSERGLDGILAALASLVGGAVLVLGGRGEPLGQRTFRRGLEGSTVQALGDEVRARVRGGELRGFTPSAPELAGRSLALPIAASGSAGRVGGAPQAWLIAAKDGGGLSEFDRLTLHQAVTIVALELLRRRIAEDTERRLAGDVLSDLIGGQLAGDELRRRLEPFGLADRVASIVLSPDRGATAACEAAMAAALRDDASPGLVAVHDHLVCALVPGLADDDLFAVAERLRDRASQDAGTSIPAGAGRARPACEARHAYHEARCALEARAFAIAAELAPPTTPGGNGNGGGGIPAAAAAPSDGVATYRDLGSFQLLLSLQDGEALRLFCDSVLGPIETGEGHYGGELMRSLEAFIECNGQWERAARRLYCHRHTLRYRIRKVEELTGRDLSSARDRIEFWLALRGQELVR
jgi:purine catabolism regulator